MNKRLQVAVILCGVVVSGGSKTDELTTRTASNLVSRIQSPIEQAREASAKAAATRQP